MYTEKTYDNPIQLIAENIAPGKNIVVLSSLKPTNLYINIKNIVKIQKDIKSFCLIKIDMIFAITGKFFCNAK